MAAKPLTLAPNHHNNTPKPVCTVLVPIIAATIIARRIRSTQVARGCGSFLFVDEGNQAFVLSADNLTGEVWVKEHFGWLVGFYRPCAGKNELEPTPEGLAEDLTYHVAGSSRHPAGADNSRKPTTDAAALQRSEPDCTGKGDISSSGGG